uniref:Reverse transcriptase domain-containing protein n=1 Tax=Panagrellus redivivus TaxID=6233 RepID=A0A7E4VET1_PANRE
MPPNSSTPKEPPGVNTSDDNNNGHERFSKESAIAYWDNVFKEFSYDAAQTDARTAEEWDWEPLPEYSAPVEHYGPDELDAMGMPPCSSRSIPRVTPSEAANGRDSRRQRREARRNRRSLGYATHSAHRAEPLRRFNRNPFIAYSTVRNAANSALQQTTGTDASAIDRSLTTPRRAVTAIANTIRDEATPQLLGNDLTERNLRIMANENYAEKLKKIDEEHQKAIDELATRMINELEEEQRLIEAQLKAMDGNGDIKHGVHYAPRKELRRRNAAGVTERVAPEATTTHTGPFAPVYKAHWIDPVEIESDMALVNEVLGTQPPVYEDRHQRVVMTADKLCLDGRKHSRHSGFVTLHTIDRGDIPAFLVSNNENCLTYRAIFPGDTRVVCVTVDDLLTGRVRITKRVAVPKKKDEPAEADKKPPKKGRGRKKKL